MQTHPSSRSRRRREPSTKTTRSHHHPRQVGTSREPIASVCISCGFEPPARARAATELRSLQTVWESALRTTDFMAHERAAQLCDELHAVANRAGRLLETPGVLLPPVRIQVPTAASGAIPREVSGALIRVAADRFAELVDGLSPADWRVSGTIGDSPITIGELVAAPLHSSHRLLAYSSAMPAIETAEYTARHARREHERRVSHVH